MPHSFKIRTDEISASKKMTLKNRTQLQYLRIMHLNNHVCQVKYYIVCTLHLEDGFVKEKPLMLKAKF